MYLTYTSNGRVCIEYALAFFVDLTCMPRKTGGFVLSLYGAYFVRMSYYKSHIQLTVGCGLVEVVNGFRQGCDVTGRGLELN